jgi:hypothetical protein
MQNFIGKKVLITTQSWFYGKDGRQYRAVHGTLKAVHEAGKELGFIPNRSHANWFIEIGELIIMGCQVMYVLETETVNTEKVEDYSINENIPEGIKTYERPCAIYLVS